MNTNLKLFSAAALLILIAGIAVFIYCNTQKAAKAEFDGVFVMNINEEVEEGYHPAADGKCLI